MCQDSEGSLNRPVIHRDDVWHVENPKPEEVEKWLHVLWAKVCSLKVSFQGIYICSRLVLLVRMKVLIGTFFSQSAPFGGREKVLPVLRRKGLSGRP